MFQARKQNAINASYFVIGVAVLEILSLIAIIVTWIYFYGEDSKNVILLGFFHVGLFVTIPLAFFTAYKARDGNIGDVGTSFVYALAEFISLISSLIGLTFRIIHYLTCDIDVFCSDPSGLGLLITLMLLVVTCVIIFASIIGFFFWSIHLLHAQR